MLKVNALQLRQSLGKVIQKLQKTGEPIILEKGRTPVAVLIGIEDFQRRFVDREADWERRKLFERLKKKSLRLPKGRSSLDLLREVRS